MASIQTGIELQDNFTNVLMGIINSVNLAVSSMEDMSQAMNANFDTSAIEGTREQLNQATIAAQELNQAMENMGGGSAPATETSQPIQWQSDTMSVFDGSGMERFQQEVQRTDEMLNALNNRQQQIEQTAAGMDILPPSAIQDISSMGSRVQNIRDRIQQIENNPLDMGTDRVNNELEQLRSQLDQALSEQENLNQAMENMDVSAANESYLRLSRTISNTERYIRANTSGQENFNRGIREGTSQAGALVGKIKGIATAYLSIRGLSSLLGKIGATDTSGAFSRIDTMNQFQKTVSIMTGDATMANAALAKLKDTTTGTAYGLDVASKATQGFLTRGMGLGAATEQVRIWADAVSFYGDGTNEKLESVVDAIGKMYSKGKVEADQLDRIYDAGIGATEIYADAVGKSVSKVKDDLSDGKISAVQFIDTVSQAMDKGVSSGAAKDAGSTWATTFANMQTAITRGWVSIIQNLDAALASRGLPSAMEMVAMFGEKIESVLNSVGNYIGVVLDLAMNLYEAMSTAGNFIVDNRGTIAPIIGSVAAAYIAYKGALFAYNVVRTITNTLEAISTARAALHAGKTFVQAAATTTATGAQVGFNGALLACPLTWIILLIIALIGVIVILANRFSGAGHVAQSAFGAICGGVRVVIEFFKNLGLMVANIALGIANAIGAVASNIMTAFHNAICSVQSWWYGLLSTVLNVVAGICEALNKLPFVEFDYSGISSAADDYAAKSAAAANNKQEYESISDAFNKGMSTFDTFGDGWVSKAYKSGADWGDGVTSKIKGMLSPKIPKVPKEDESDYASALANSSNLTAANTGDTAKNTSKIADSVAITSEDLKYIRDMAEQDYINRFTTAKITVNQTNHNTVNNDMDLDGVTEHLRTTIEEQMFSTAEGAH